MELPEVMMLVMDIHITEVLDYQPRLGALVRLRQLPLPQNLRGMDSLEELLV